LVPLLAIGLVPALALAWVFEWTPQGLRRESTIDHSQDAPLPSHRTSDRVLIVLLALALTALAVDRFVFRPVPATPSVAVLPFLDLSPAGDQDFFASGIAEELLNLLAKIPGLKVAARTSSFSFKDRDVPIPEIARVLNVRYVLEGSVRTANDQLRITAQLIDAHTGYHLWSETYDKSGGALFEVQDDVARQVAAVLEVTILGEPPRVERADPEAHALVLEAESLEAQSTADSMALAVATFQRALELDPAYARAWTGLAVTYTNMAEHGTIDWDKGHRLAIAAAESALALDPQSSRALSQLAWIARTYEADTGRAAEYLERALVAEPTSPDLLDHTAVLLQAIGRQDEAVALHEYSVARDPVNTRGIFNLALAYYFAGRLEDARRQLTRLLALAPRYHGARYRLGTIDLLLGDPDGALKEFEAEDDEAFRVKGRALALWELDQRDAADAALAELIERWGERWPSEVAHVYAYRGDTDRAFAWLEKDFVVAGAAGWGEWRLMHLLDGLHADPRWEAFLTRVAASDAQLAAIPFRLPDATAAVIDGARS